MEKNIVETVTDNKGDVVEMVADYIGVRNFAKAVENLYRWCLEGYDNSEEIEECLSDSIGSIHWLSLDFAFKANREMKEYLHMKDHSLCGYFANIKDDYPEHITGTRWSFEYDGDDYFDLFPQMVARLDAAEDSKRADEDRAYLAEWYFNTFGKFGITYNFGETVSEIAYELEQQCATA